MSGTGTYALPKGQAFGRRPLVGLGCSRDKAVRRRSRGSSGSGDAYGRVVPAVLSVNVGIARSIASKSGMSGIDKRPTTAPVAIDVPVEGGSGLDGDTVCDTKNHGGVDQAVYAYAREDLDVWQTDLGRVIPSGTFGENLTIVGLDITDARIGERWRVGSDCVLQVTCPRVPCRTFAVWLNRQGWVKAFAARAIPGAYLRVINPGRVAAGDPITIEYRPEHDVSIGPTYRSSPPNRICYRNCSRHETSRPRPSDGRDGATQSSWTASCHHRSRRP